jgi:hypothetical protein
MLLRSLDICQIPHQKGHQIHKWIEAKHARRLSHKIVANNCAADF